jgi:LacI family transcriptional regulator
MARRATVRDIAAETGVSIATVSRALSGHPSVAAPTRDLVRAAADRLGAAAPRAGVPRAGAPGAVFVRCPYVLADYFGTIVSSIAETLDLHGRQVILNAGEAAQRRTVLAELSHRTGISGTILILPPESDAELAALRAHPAPFVVVDPRTPPPPDMAAVSAAHLAGARQLTAHLVALGHRRIGLIGGPDEWSASDARRAGHAAALADVGVISAPDLVRSEHPTVDSGHRAALDLLARADRPTAIVGFNDKVAVGAMRAAAERGLRVPEDVSIAGFDDIDLSRATQPMLTTVRQPLEEMGRMAVGLLLRLMDRHALHALHVELATELVVRGSTGPVPARSA